MSHCSEKDERERVWRKTKLLNVKGETDAPIYVQQSRAPETGDWCSGDLQRQRPAESTSSYLSPTRSLMGAPGLGSRLLVIEKNWSDP